MIRQGFPNPESYCQKWSLRHLQIMKNSPSAVTVVSADTGQVLSQNTSSMALYGNQGSFDADLVFSNGGRSENPPVVKELIKPESVDRAVCLGFSSPFDSLVEREGIAVGSTSLFADRDCSGEDGLSFLQLLFLGNEQELQRLKSTVELGIFLSRIRITSRRLRSSMLLPSLSESYHDIQIVCTMESVTFEKIYIISQTDVTETVLAQRKLHEANGLLAEERDRLQAVLQRQYELIDMLYQQISLTNTGSSLDPFNEKIQLLRNNLSNSKYENPEPQDIHLLRQIGQDSCAWSRPTPTPSDPFRKRPSSVPLYVTSSDWSLSTATRARSAPSLMTVEASWMKMVTLTMPLYLKLLLMWRRACSTCTKTTSATMISRPRM